MRVLVAAGAGSSADRVGRALGEDVRTRRLSISLPTLSVSKTDRSPSLALKFCREGRLMPTWHPLLMRKACTWLIGWAERAC